LLGNVEMKKLGQMISKGHKNYDLMFNIQQGIRCLSLLNNFLVICLIFGCSSL
jgi:hypothetical protein